MTAPRPIFTAAARGTHRVALVSVTVVTTARATVAYTDARCANCNRRIMAIPGVVALEVFTVAQDVDRTGRGRVVGCKRCGALNEIVEHLK